MRVESVATGFMLIRRHVIDSLIAAHPEWKYKGDGDGQDEYAVFDFAIVDGNYIGEELFVLPQGKRTWIQNLFGSNDQPATYRHSRVHPQL
jgi:hypothetical protein